jgi:hypothetical protein
LGIAAGLFGSIPAFLVIGFLSRRRHEMWPVRWAVFALSLTLATACAAFVNSHNPYATLVVGFNEEFWKVTPLLLLVFFLPSAVSGTRDGLVYGALGGLGFNVVELAVYFIRLSYPQSGILEGLIAQFGRLGLWGINNHVIWAALVGAGIGYAVQHPDRRRRWLVAFGAYLLAAFTHLLQDNLVGALLLVGITIGLVAASGGDTSGDLSNMSPEGVSAAKDLLQTATGLEVIAINIVILPILAVMVVRSGRWERRTIAEQLQTEASDVVSPADRSAAATAGAFGNRKVEGSTRRTSKHIRRAQDALAFRKLFAARSGVDVATDAVADTYRDMIRTLRAPA